MKNEKNWVEYRGKTMPFTVVERMQKWRDYIENPQLVNEKLRHSAAIGMYRCGATWEQIAAHLQMSPTYAEQIVNGYLSSRTSQPH